MKESRVTCGSCAQLTCMMVHKSRLDTDFLEMSLITVICPKNLFHMKSHISCSSLCLHMNHAC